MNLTKISEALLRKSIVLLLGMAATAFAQGHPAAPAQRPAAPAPHPSAPAQHAPAQHAPAPHTAAPAQHAPAAPHAGAPNRAPQGHPQNTPQRPGTPNGQHPATAARPGAAQARPGAGGTASKPGGPAPRTAGPATRVPGGIGAKTGRPAPKTAGSLGSRPGSAGARTAPHNVSLRGGGTARVGSGGQIRSVNRNGMHIEHNLHGGRTISTNRNGKRIVSTGKNRGYTQKSYMTRGGHSYYQRTSYDHGHYHAGVYRGYSYGGETYYGYYPETYYSPAFYGWVDNPWPAPVDWGVAAWGWADAPWYAYYGFTPYPTYAAPYFWLTDYLIAANLQAAYAAIGEVPVVPVEPVVSAGLPLRIVEHEGNSADSPVWTFNGYQGIGQFGTGNQPLTIERFDSGTIAVRRRDTSGPWGGSALYVGQIAGNFVSGQVTYYDPSAGTRVGPWTGTIMGWAPTVAAAPVVAVAPAMPPVLNECEGSACGTWTWDGSHYNAVWGNGSIGVLTVAKWDGNMVVLTRIDPAGVTAGITATYTGSIVNQNTITGSATYFWPGRPEGNHQQGWSASSPTSLLVAAAPAVATVPTMPPVLNECDGGFCGTWTWDGSHYRAVWNQGSVAILTVAKWDAQSIVITRVDPAGTTAGNTSTYTGVITGPNTASGSETGVYQGNGWSLPWNITSPTPLLVTAAAPEAVAVAEPAPQAAAPTGFDHVELTPEVKQAIAEEVKAQLQAEQASSRHSGQGSSDTQSPTPTNEVPPALDPARRTFIVSTDLAVTADGQECSLSQGDVITRLTDKPDSDQKVNVSIASSKKNDCAAGKLVAVSVDDLQEMRNHLSEQLDEGMKKLAAKQGTGKMPKSPSTTTTAGDIPAPQADQTAAQDLQQQQSAADQTETEVKQEAAN